MNRAAAAAASGTGVGPAWQEAALDPQTRADPWELEGACCVLRRVDGDGDGDVDGDGEVILGIER